MPIQVKDIIFTQTRSMSASMSFWFSLLSYCVFAPSPTQYVYGTIYSAFVLKILLNTDRPTNPDKKFICRPLIRYNGTALIILKSLLLAANCTNLSTVVSSDASFNVCNTAVLLKISLHVIQFFRSRVFLLNSMHHKCSTLTHYYNNIHHHILNVSSSSPGGTLKEHSLSTMCRQEGRSVARCN